jgi:cytochrome P450
VERDDRLDLPYLLAEVANLFAAGNGTTAHMLVSTMLLLVQHPAELDRVREDRALIPTMLEEAMRLESPVQWLQRIVTSDTELAGVTVPAGSLVLVLWGAANRDDRKFEDPERFRIDRPSVAKHQTAFGYGIHMCVGAPLARLEGRIAFGRLLDRLTNFRLVGPDPITHIPNINQRAPTAVQIEFEEVRG